MGFVWIIACYSAVRFGAKDALTHSAAGFSLIGTVAIGMRWQPTGSAIPAALGLLPLAIAMFFHDGRKAVRAIAILSFTQGFVWMNGLILFATVGKYFFQPLEPNMKVLFFAVYFIFTWLTCAVCTWVHRTTLE